MDGYALLPYIIANGTSGRRGGGGSGGSQC